MEEGNGKYFPPIALFRPGIGSLGVVGQIFTWPV